MFSITYVANLGTPGSILKEVEMVFRGLLGIF